jgi:hypothetical protein
MCRLNHLKLDAAILLVKPDAAILLIKDLLTSLRSVLYNIE